MDLKQVVAVVTVSETGSVTRAAELLHIVQPALTRQIKQLEDELGTQLFVRTRQGMRLTPAGETFVAHGRRALAELDRARDEIRPDPEDLHGTVTVGLLASTAELLADSLVAAVAERHPHVLLRLSAGYAGDVRGWLESGMVDLGLMYQVDQPAGLEIRPLVEEPLWAIAPASAGLQADRPVCFEEVARHPLVMPSEMHGLRRIVNAASARTGVGLTVVAETNTVAVQRQLVIHGHGWTVLPVITVVDDLERSQVSGAPLSDAMLARQIVLALPKNPPPARAVRAVASILVEEMDIAIRADRWPSAQWLPRHRGGAGAGQF